MYFILTKINNNQINLTHTHDIYIYIFLYKNKNVMHCVVSKLNICLDSMIIYYYHCDMDCNSIVLDLRICNSKYKMIYKITL